MFKNIWDFLDMISCPRAYLHRVQWEMKIKHDELVQLIKQDLKSQERNKDYADI